MRERGGGGQKGFPSKFRIYWGTLFDHPLSPINFVQTASWSTLAAVLVLLASPYRRARFYQHSRCNAWTGPIHGRSTFQNPELIQNRCYEYC